MSDPIVVVDSSEIHEGKLEELKSGLEELVAFVEANEPEPIAYGIYFTEDETRMTVVQIHPSSASMEFHMEIAAPVFRRFAGLLTLARVDVYGKPSAALLDQLRRKAELLGSTRVVVNDLHAGFARFESGARAFAGTRTTNVE